MLDRRYCVVCDSTHLGHKGWYRLIPDDTGVAIVSFCSLDCAKEWFGMSGNEKANHRSNHNQYEKLKQEVEQMKVYKATVEKGKIAVSEPDGATAVLIFDTQSEQSGLSEAGKSMRKAGVKKCSMKKRNRIIRGRYARGETIDTIAADYILSPKRVANICSGVSKSSRQHNVRFRCKRRKAHSYAKLYEHALGSSIRDYVSKEVQAGFQGDTTDMMRKIAARFEAAGIGKIWKSRKKMRYSIFVGLLKWGVKKGEVGTWNVLSSEASVPIAPEPPKKPTTARAVYVSVLGCSLSEYTKRQLKAGVNQVDLINDICSKVEPGLAAAGFKIDTNKIGAYVFITARKMKFSEGGK